MKLQITQLSNINVDGKKTTQAGKMYIKTEEALVRT